jgi:predicted Zn-dependent peptidase
MATSSVTQKVLSNGLTVLIEHIPQAQSVGIGFFVKTGSRDEQVSESGVSHFLEHMLFKSTQRRSALDITFEMGNIGAQSNAFTSEENTVYYATVLPEYLSAAQDVLTDQMMPILNDAEFETEKKVILEEIALYQDKPQFYLFENAHLDFFAGHSAGNSVLGTVASISALSRAQMKQYFDRRYAPNNIVFVCAGKVDSDRVVQQLEAQSAGWLPRETPRSYTPFAARSTQKEFRKANLQQGHVLILSDGPSAQDEDRYAMGLVAMMIGDATGSRIYYELVQTGIAEGAGSDCDERDRAGSFYAYAVTTPENISQVSSILNKILDTPREFSQADLSRAQTKSISRLVANGELPMGRLMSLGSEWQYHGVIHNLKENIERIRSVSLNDIERAIGRFPLKVRSEYHLLPA